MGVSTEDELRAAVAAEYDRALSDLKRVLRQPSVAAQNRGIEETVAELERLFTEAGATVEVFRGHGMPLLLAEFAGASERTLLFYNHYDVQPEDPLDEWKTPPFEPVERDGHLYARGVSDNKGDLICRLGAVRALQAVHGGTLPCRVKFMIEGEEEIGSPNLPAYLAEVGDRFAADACIWEFGQRDAEENVLLYAGLKGICYLQLTLETAAVDLHSSLAPLVENPAWRLVEALSSMRAPDGRVLIDGFYDGVPEWGPAEQAAVADIPFDPESFRERNGLRRVLGDTHAERMANWLGQPTFTICGLESGYTGPGSKTVLPRRAQAKIDIRLVGDQDPVAMADKVRRHLERHGYGDIVVEELAPEAPYRTDPDNAFVELVAATAAVAHDGARVVLYPTSAGSGPMHPVGAAIGHRPIISTGVGWAGSGAHGPNENIRLDDFRRGMLHMALLLERFGAGEG